MWIQTAFSVIKKQENQLTKQKTLLEADNRFLLFDIANSQRLKLSMGKTSSLLKPQHLPSNQLIQKKQQSPQLKKLLLKNLKQNWKNKQN